MRKLIPLLLCGILAASCEDPNYDLGKIKTDDITIGDETSSFKMPLAEVVVALSDISGNKPGEQVNIQDLLSDVNLWLPTAIPSAKDAGKTVDYVEIDLLQSNPAYLGKVLDALIEEMAEGTTDKMDQVLDFIWDNEEYKNEFLPLLHLPGTIDPDQFETIFKYAFKTQFATNTALHDQAKLEASKNLSDLEIKPITFAIKAIKLGDDVLDMLTENLDPKGTQKAKNTLSIYGEIDSKLPLGIRLDPAFVSKTNSGDNSQPTTEKVLVTIENVQVAADGESPIPETRLYGEDIRAIVDGSTVIEIPVLLKQYYPSKPFQTGIDKQIVINLRLVKRGGLTLKL